MLKYKTDPKGMAGVMSGASPWRHVRLGDLTPTIEHRGDGTVILRAVNRSETIQRCSPIVWCIGRVTRRIGRCLPGG